MFRGNGVCSAATVGGHWVRRRYKSAMDKDLISKKKNRHQKKLRQCFSSSGPGKCLWDKSQEFNFKKSTTLPSVSGGSGSDGEGGIRSLAGRTCSEEEPMDR